MAPRTLTRMLALYCDVERIVRPGETAPVHVSTTADRFRLELYRFGGPRTPVWRSDALAGQLVAAGDPAGDWAWPRYDVEVPDHGRGLYVVVGVELSGGATRRAPSLVGYNGTALLTVLPRAPRAPALYKLPVRTFQAYNPAGGGSAYVNQTWEEGRVVVGLRRPGAGTGGPTAEPLDVYAPERARQTFWHWDARFLSWAAGRGYHFDIVLDTQLDRQPSLLDGYRALVTAGHDEYWTAPGRQAVERFVAGGGSIAVFGGNTCWWRAEVAGGAMRVAKCATDPSTGPDLWWRTGRPENLLLGLSYRNGGGWWGAARPATRYRLRPAGDPLLTGIDTAAFEALPALAGYEVDGHAYPPGEPWRVADVGGYPANLEVLAYAPLVAHEPAGWERQHREPGNCSPPVATVAYYRRGRSLVFNAGTVDWAAHLGHACVERLTCNVLDTVGMCGRSPENRM